MPGKWRASMYSLWPFFNQSWALLKMFIKTFTFSQKASRHCRKYFLKSKCSSG